MKTVLRYVIMWGKKRHRTVLISVCIHVISFIETSGKIHKLTRGHQFWGREGNLTFLSHVIFSTI